MIAADQYIIDFLRWCHANPMTTGAAITALTWVAKRTKCTWDDRVVKRLAKVTGHDPA